MKRLALLLFLGACCHAPPPRVITEIVHDPCQKTPPPIALPVPKPFYCLQGQPCPKCLPGEVCFELADAAVLTSNVEAMQDWQKTTWTLCQPPK